MILSEAQHTGGFIASLAAHTRSLQTVLIRGGVGAERVLTAGMILGRTLEDAAAIAVPRFGNIGNGAMGVLTASAAAQIGRHLLRIHTAATNAGGFHVFDPQGQFIGSGTVGVAFSAGGLAFTLSDGSTDFAAGDSFEILVTGAYVYEQIASSGVLGEQNAAGILLADTTAPDGVDVKAAIVARDAEVTSAEIVWPAGVSAAFKASRLLQLEGLGVLAR